MANYKFFLESNNLQASLFNLSSQEGHNNEVKENSTLGYFFELRFPLVVGATAESR